jgi:hypothetical protein
MISTFGIHASVTTLCNDDEIRVNQFSPGSHGEAAAMNPVKEISIEIMRGL